MVVVKSKVLSQTDLGWNPSCQMYHFGPINGVSALRQENSEIVSVKLSIHSRCSVKGIIFYIKHLHPNKSCKIQKKWYVFSLGFINSSGFISLVYGDNSGVQC